MLAETLNQPWGAAAVAHPVDTENAAGEDELGEGYDHI